MLIHGLCNLMKKLIEDFSRVFFLIFKDNGMCSIHVNPLSPGIKLQILLLLFHTFLTEVVGRSC